MSEGQEPPALREDLGGTFKDGLRAPIPRWFSYPVGFSPGLVREAISKAALPSGSIFYDPFGGTATSLIVARQLGLEAHGLEAHPFIHSVGQTKLRWNAEPGLSDAAERLIAGAVTAVATAPTVDPASVPALLVTCFDAEQLRRLLALRDHLRSACPDGSALRGLAELVTSVELCRLVAG